MHVGGFPLFILYHRDVSLSLSLSLSFFLSFFLSSWSIYLHLFTPLFLLQWRFGYIVKWTFCPFADGMKAEMLARRGTFRGKVVWSGSCTDVHCCDLDGAVHLPDLVKEGSALPMLGIDHPNPVWLCWSIVVHGISVSLSLPLFLSFFLSFSLPLSLSFSPLVSPFLFCFLLRSII